MVCICVGGYRHAIRSMWRSEDNSRVSSLSTLHGFQGMAQVIRLAQSALPHEQSHQSGINLLER